MVRIKGISALVQVSGNIATEYKDDQFDGDPLSEASTYIEAVAGARFNIWFTIPSTIGLAADSLYVRYSVDGITFNGFLVAKACFARAKKDFTVAGCSVAADSDGIVAERPFQFEELITYGNIHRSRPFHATNKNARPSSAQNRDRSTKAGVQ